MSDTLPSSTTPAPPVTHVIFDFDGLLVDTEPCYTVANAKCLEPYGKEFTMELKSRMMGRKHNEAIADLLEQCGIGHLVTPEVYNQTYTSILHTLFDKAPALPGAEKLVRHLASKNIPTAICTGSASTDFLLKAHPHRHWLDLIGLHVLTGDDPSVKRGKPHPDGFLETMNRFDVAPAHPSNVLVFEDAPNGVKAALAAGMQCVQVPHPHPAFQVSEEEKKKIRVLESLQHFLPTEYGLPGFD